METLTTILAGVLVTAATYMLLSNNIIRVVLGTAILSHAAHLVLMTMGNGLKSGSAPLLGEEAASYVDALPQALILTSIVISFAVTALSLVIAYRTYQVTGTDNLSELRGMKDE